VGKNVTKLKKIYPNTITVKNIIVKIRKSINDHHDKRFTTFPIILCGKQTNNSYFNRYKIML